MRCGRVLWSTALLLLATASSRRDQQPLAAQGQRSGHPSITIDRAWTVPEILLAVTFRTRESEAVVPYCSQTEEGEPFLCTSGVHLQTQARGGWRAVGLRKTPGVLGASVPISRAAAQFVPAHKTASFLFRFNTHVYSIARGQRLRLVVDAWPDKQAQQAGEKPMQLISDAFACP